MKTRTVLFCAALIAMGAACNRETDRIDERAEGVIDQKDDLREAKDDVEKTLGNTARETAEVAHTSADLATAEVDFAQERDTYVDALRDRFRVFEMQNEMAQSILADPSMTETDRATANERVMTFARELGEAEMSIDAVATATAAQWESARTTVDNAFEQLGSAHDDAFEALSVNRKIIQNY